MFKVATFRLGKSFVLICGILFIFFSFFYLYVSSDNSLCVYIRNCNNYYQIIIARDAFSFNLIFMRMHI